jgi:hypothetical protein
MARIWEPQPFEVLQSWIDAILEEASDELNDWETHFISDIAFKVANKWSLTKYQEEKLESIYAEKTK